MGWLIWWWSGLLSEVHLTVQRFAITLMDAAEKPGVLLPKCHPGSIAWKQITKYICWAGVATAVAASLQADACRLQEKLLKVIFVLTALHWMETGSSSWHTQHQWCYPCYRRSRGCGQREWWTVNGTGRGLGDRYPSHSQEGCDSTWHHSPFIKTKTGRRSWLNVIMPGPNFNFCIKVK